MEFRALKAHLLKAWNDSVTSLSESKCYFHLLSAPNDKSWTHRESYQSLSVVGWKDMR